MSITKSILILFIGLTLGFGIGNRVTRSSGRITLESNPKKEKLNRLIDYIDDLYVNPVDTDSIVDTAVTNILNKLDPHSTYISKQEMAHQPTHLPTHPPLLILQCLHFLQLL